MSRGSGEDVASHGGSCRGSPSIGNRGESANATVTNLAQGRASCGKYVSADFCQDRVECNDLTPYQETSPARATPLEQSA